ncbi:Tat pathway signal protein [Streptomyces sp. ITFR-16]|uniref:Tat pathway signal protein n=1 Tax=Streptomyces sp. ITFR-16 TaxID=3075198 RepID=UPI0028897518|nr:Tat pathway signal protein [Streptomyces sp. ITFR-16]WNI20766.1 Tat pathway signal protein [Streptomyces sp. ITFR-16]
MARTRNALLAARIAETGWSQPKVAAALLRVARESGATELYGVGRSHIAMWIQGTRPSGRAPHILCETLTRRLGRTVTPADIGLEAAPDPAGDERSDWSADTLTMLAELGRDDLDMLHRRQILANSAYSVAGLAVPAAAWWQTAPAAADRRPVRSPRSVTAADIEDIRQTTAFFSARDQQRGGAAGRSALAAHLTMEAAPLLSRSVPGEQLRRELHSAVAEMAYLAGWMGFDASEQRAAQRYFTVAVKLAAEAGDGPLAGHVLRAMAHQAVDLGHPRHALDLAAASMEPTRYGRATWREKALLGIVHARALAVSGDRAGTLAAIGRAERDLGRDTGDAPGRVGFFGEASLAHETACALRDLGNPRDAEIHFRRSVATRRRRLYARTHSVTLGYLGAVQVRQGHLDEACATWNSALDAMSGVQSGRAREVIVRMQKDLSPVRRRGGRHVVELDRRAGEILRTLG